MDCSPPGSSVHEILQTRILEWVAIPFSRGSSQPRDWTLVSCIAGRFFIIWATREACCSGLLSLISGWPKYSFGFFCNILWENRNKPLGQPNIFLNRVRPSSMLGIRRVQGGRLLPSHWECVLVWLQAWSVPAPGAAPGHGPHPPPSTTCPSVPAVLAVYWLSFGFLNTLHPLFSRPRGLCTCVYVPHECPLVTSVTNRCLWSFPSHPRHRSPEVLCPSGQDGLSLCPFFLSVCLSRYHIFMSWFDLWPHPPLLIDLIIQHTLIRHLLVARSGDIKQEWLVVTGLCSGLWILWHQAFLLPTHAAHMENITEINMWVNEWFSWSPSSLNVW